MSKLSKRLLSWLLLAAMLCTLLPTAAFADDAAEVLTEEPQAGDAVTEAEVSQDTDEAQPVTLGDGLEADTVAAITVTAKPEDGTTTNEPFLKGTAGSNSFRIPALVTLSDGTLVAAADARWNTTYDGGGLDTIVSRSSDNGANWNYTFANYLGDNGNEYNGSSSTCFIDPALVVDNNDTIYMLCDLYPYGVALNGSGNTAPSTEVGFDKNGCLLLKKDGESSYNYYLDGGTIYSSSGTAVSGYTVDDHFNITGTDGTNSNLFFSDSPFKVVRTGFLYLTTSTDKGATWSAPTLLNLKTTSEQVCLVAPGRGLCTADGTIVFPVYSYNGSQETQKMSFIYYKDGEWKRSSNFTGAEWSSESAVVELKDGTLRFFYRNGTKELCYVDYDMTKKSWGSQVKTGVATNSNCQISAITYSKAVNGNQMILVSCPAGPSGGSDQSGASYRKNGKIFVFSVDSSGSMTPWETVDVPSVHSENSFMYSCLTALDDGSVAILYEDNESGWGTGDDKYYQMSFATFDAYNDLNIPTSNADVSDPEEGEDDNDDGDSATNEKKVELFVEETQTETISGTNLSGNVNKDDLDTGIATVDVSGQDEQSGGTTYTVANLTYNDLLNQNKSWTSTPYYYYLDGTYYTVYVKRESGYNSQYKYTLGYKKNSNSKNYTTIQTTTVAVGDPVTEVTLYEITEKEAIPASTTLSFTGVAPGETSVTVGDTKYTIKVKAREEKESLSVTVGSSVKLNPTVYTGCSVTYEVIRGGDYITLSDGTVTGKAEGTAVVTATVAKDGTTYATYTYTITVSDGTAVELKVGETDTISMDAELTDGQTIQWTTADSRYVGVAGKYDANENAYTNAAVIQGQNVTATDAPIVVTGTIYDADGSVAGTKKWLVTVIEGDADTNTDSRYIYMNVTAMEHCTVYYSINAGELIKINGTGVLIDGQKTGHFNIMFFAAPDEGYALTYMCVTGSAKQYYTLSNGNPDGTGSEAWPFVANNPTTIPTSSKDSAWKSGHGFCWPLMEGNMTIDQMKALFSQAIALGCDGVTSLTKNGTLNLYTEVQFAAQKLPTMDKEIVAVKHKNGTVDNYEPKMTIEREDTIIYKVTVTEYAEETGDIWTENEYTVTSPITSSNKPTYSPGSYGTVTYDQVTGEDGAKIDQLTDELTESKFYTNENLIENKSGTNFLSKSEESETTHIFYTQITLTEDNFADVVFDGKITNTASLTYTYSSQYTEGVLNTSADAVAELKVNVPEYVIDFGLPVKLEIPAYFGDQNTETSPKTYTIQKATATYGTCEVNSDGISITYKPDKVLQGTDTIYLNVVKAGDSAENGVEAQILVHPANNVLYEESFVTKSTDWTTAGTEGKSEQDAPNDTTDVYGYDKAYIKTANEFSNGSALKATVNSANTGISTFTFTGDGLELMGECGQTTGVMYVRVSNGYEYEDADGNTKYTNKVYVVDTYFNGYLTNGSDGSNVEAGTLKQVPLVHDLELPYGEHTVSIIGYNIKGGASQNTAVAALSLEASETLSLGTSQSRILNLDAILAEMGDEDAVVEYISMNEVLGGSDEATAVYATQVYSTDATSGYDVYIDGFRVYNTLETEPDAYVEKEKGAKFVSLYEVVSGSTWNEEDKTGTGIVYVENVNDADTSYGKYKTSGPQNEIYLGKGQGIAFNVGATGFTAIQVSAKAITGTPVLGTSSSTYVATINTQTELYYKITSTEGTFVIWNNSESDSILSLVDLKVIGGDYEAAAITTQDLDNAIYLIQNPVDTEEPEDDADDEDDWENPFQDVTAGRFYYEAIRWLYSHGIIKGMTDWEFGLDTSANRAMVITMLYRLEGSPKVTGTSKFSDVEKGRYYEKAVIWAEKIGLVDGYPDGTFQPEKPITREEMVKMLYAYVEYKGLNTSGSANLNKFADGSKVQNYAQNAMKWAVDNGIMKGYNEDGNSYVKPQDGTRRSEMATLLYRVQNLIRGN